MTAAVVLLTLAFVLLAVLLLSLNLRSGWRWPVKAAAILVTGAFFVAFFVGIAGMLGWPTERVPPDHFRLHASLVREPGKSGGGVDVGAIYLWLSPLGEDAAPVGPPRAHALPYSRELHERVAAAESRRSAGRTIEGRLRPKEAILARENLQIELFEAPPGEVPSKTAG